MRKTVGSLLQALTVLAPLALSAQTAATPPTYNVLTIFRETVKPGKGNAHDAMETAWAAASAAAKAPAASIAMSAMTGPTENWYMSAYLNWADFEKANKAGEANAALTAVNKQYSSQEGEYLSDGRMMILTPMMDLSYGAPANLPASRYFSVQRISVRPGHTAEYEESRKIVKAAHESAKLTDHYTLWRVVAGAPAGTYFQMVARKSLAEIDEGATIHGAAYIAALGGPEGQKKLDAMTASAVISSETDHFAFAPQQSFPPPEWVTADPAFWKHKPVVKKTP
jgi:hypothetical protein